MSEADYQTLYCTNPHHVAEVTSHYIRDHQLFANISALGLAVSGGADSVALLHLLTPLAQAANITLHLLHLNHGLRSESEQEAEFVANLAHSYNLPLITAQAHLATKDHHGLSLEMAAREARLDFYASSCLHANLDAIATGHHADDLVETLLLRLSRGSGATGLTGLRSSTPAPADQIAKAGRSFYFIRPLLPISTRALRGWLQLHNHTWHEDHTNLTTTIPRNLLRQRIIPMLEQEWSPSFSSAACRSIEILQSEDELLDQLAQHELNRCTTPAGLNLATLSTCHPALQRRVMRHWLFQQNQRNAGFERVQQLLALYYPASSRKTTALQLDTTTRALLHHNTLHLEHHSPPTPPPPPAHLPPHGSTTWGKLRFTSTPAHGIHAHSNGIGNYPALCSLCEDTLQGQTLLIRHRTPGDRIAPTGLHGSRKVQDILTDAKIKEEERDHIPLLTLNSRVLWLPGYRIARDYALTTPDAPSRIIRVELA